MNEIVEVLRSLIVNPESELKFSNNYELLVAVMLSAQCTDKRVNIVTEKLFKVASTPKDMVNLGVSGIESYIKSCNYYHNKAKNILNASKDIVERFDGQVPDNYDDLVSLSGVGNKTACVVLAVGFNQNTFPVDTHVLRVCNRLGLVSTKNPTICQGTMQSKFKSEKWGEIHHLILLFGRYYCTARNPKCDDCKLKKYCVYVGEKDVSR
ncbi:MAG: endonuclease III [Clostridiales bacterium]|nr:endonuclease III [Clostridiales bacterium]